MLARLVASNPDVARAAEAVRRARMQRGGALGVLDPILNVQLDLRRSVTPVEQEFIDDGIFTNGRYSLTAGVSRTFSPGTQVAFSLSQAVSRSESSYRLTGTTGRIEEVDGPNVQTTMTLSVTQPLLRGFGRDQVLVSELLAARTVDVRELEVRQIAGTRALEALTAYAELRYSAEETALRARSLARSERQLRIAEAEVEAGQVAPIELDLVREQIASRREALLVAEADAARRSRQLQQLLGATVEAAATIEASDELFAPPPVSFHDGICDEVAAQSVDVAVLRGQVVIAEVRSEVTEDAIRPQLDATAGLTNTGLDAAWADSVADTVAFRGPTVFGGLVFTTVLRNRAARAEHDVAEAEVMAADFEVEELSRSLCFQAQEAVEALRLLEARAEISAERVGIAERAVAAAEERFVSGLSTVQAGIDALDTLEAAEVALLRVRIDAETAWWQLQHLRGRLVDSLELGP